MKILALDISTKAGWAFFDEARLVEFGRVGLDDSILSFGEYPWCYMVATEHVANQLWTLIEKFNPDVLVIEETNLGKSRYAQKTLEFIHHALLQKIRAKEVDDGWMHRPSRPEKVIYLSSSTWRQALGLVMSKEDKKNNAKLSKAKKTAAESGVKLDKQALGIRGKVNKKHLALRYVNETYGMNLKVKDNDIADAICLAAAYLKGAHPCDGVM